MRPTRIPLLAVLLSAACGSGQMGAGSSYPGVALFQYSGHVSGTAPTSYGIQFVWQVAPPPSMDSMTLATEGSIAQDKWAWKMGLFWAPRVWGQQLQESEPAFVRGNAIAVPEGWHLDQLDLLPSSGNPAYGADVTHWVLYFFSDVQPGSLTEWWLGGAHPTPLQYWLAEVTPAPCLDADALTACVAELRGRGVPTDEAAQGFCRGPRVALVEPSTESEISLGTFEVATGACP